MMRIQIAGPGCINCTKLEDMCREAIHAYHLDAQIERITERQDYSRLGVFATPGLLINGHIISTGRMPAYLTVEKWIKSAEDWPS